MNIEEDYVSYEVAKLLKGKGFNAKCDKCYAYFAYDDIRVLNLKYPKSAQSLSENRYPCITLQMAMRWLREVHKICIVVYPFTHRERGTYTSDICTVTMTMEEGHLRGVWNSYEEACEASIKYSLENLI